MNSKKDPYQMQDPHSLRSRRAAPGVLLVLGLLLTAALPAAQFAPVTDAERQLKEVPDHPGAPAVVLFHRGKVDIMDYPSEVSSILEVEMRIKILSEEGMEYAEVEVPHSRFLRLKNFNGRTVLPDGTEIPLDDDAVFEEVSSRSERTFLTKAAFPGVTVGAILDYKYTLRWDSIYFLEPWYFNHNLPTLVSEVTYVIPRAMEVQPTPYQTTRNEMQTDIQKSPRGNMLKVWMENLQAVPDEPLGYSYADLSNRLMLVPKSIFLSGTRYPLLDTWKDVCDIFDGDYKKFMRKSRQARKKAKELTAEAASPREEIAAVLAFVRDEIASASSYSIFIDEDTGADKALDEGRATDPEKALLLAAMLEGLKLDTRLVWAVDRFERQPDLNVPNPYWFDRTLVMVELEEGERLFLDPGDRGLGFARLAPSVEGTPALVFDARKPETLELPEAAFDDNVRHARLQLALDEEGRVSGKGSLVLTGHHAWRKLRLEEDEEATREAWTDDLEEGFPGYAILDLEVEEKIAEQEVRVGFDLLQNEEEVLGDETSLDPSRPLGPISQAFTLPTAQRQTPVQLDFADRDVVELEITWPEPWEVDVVPGTIELDNGAGAFVVDVEHDPAARTLRFRRRFDTRERHYKPGEPYALLRQLYGTVEKSDAQDLVLVRR